MVFVINDGTRYRLGNLVEKQRDDLFDILEGEVRIIARQDLHQFGANHSIFPIRSVVNYAALVCAWYTKTLTFINLG